MAVSIAGFSEKVSAVIQDNTLVRQFQDPLLPNLVWRGEATPDLWPANIGENSTFTRRGLIDPDTDDLTPGSDPEVAEYDTEQWTCTAGQKGKRIFTHMPTDYVTIVSKLLQDTDALGIHAAMSMNRAARNKLLKAYLSGDTVTLAAATAGALSLRVASLSGFTQQILNGQLQAVSTANPLTITFSGGTEVANTVIGYVPDNASYPDGPGVLLLGAAVASGVAQREGVRAATRSRIVRVGAGATVDAITSGNVLVMSAINSAIAWLRDRGVGPHADGLYHVHLGAFAEQQLMADTLMTGLWAGTGDSGPFAKLTIGDRFGCRFFRNGEMPTAQTVKSTEIRADAGGAGGATYSPELGGELTTAAGLAIQRTVVTGGGVLVEKYLDESKFITEAGVSGKVGQFSVITNGVAMMTDRIRYLMLRPQDALQQMIQQVWSWSGDFGVPSDVTCPKDAARYKRAVVIEHA
jgi:hypothetical protein